MEICQIAGLIVVLAAGPAFSSPKMVLIKGGQFEMGCNGCNLDDALPIHRVEISTFWLQATPVTNADFSKFVRDTNYVTVAERKPDPKDYPTIPPEKLTAGSAVFMPPSSIATLANALIWWRYVEGASWQRPDGPKSTFKGKEEHPVVHIAYPDAEAYCKWRGMRLPTESEFEFSARGGLTGKKYAWGNELKPGGKWAANIWQGTFPVKNTAEDGYTGTSPVGAFPPNNFGLYDMGGNVWHWTSDWYRPDTYRRDAGIGVVRDPQGPASGDDPDEPGVAKRVQRGGSFLCSDRYCIRYLVGSRGKGAEDSAGSNIGFRCAQGIK